MVKSAGAVSRNAAIVAVSGKPEQRVLSLETVSATGELLWSYAIPATELGYKLKE